MTEFVFLIVWTTWLKLRIIKLKFLSFGNWSEMWEHFQCTRWEQKCEGMFSVFDGSRNVRECSVYSMGAEMWGHVQCIRWEQKCEGMFSVLDVSRNVRSCSVYSMGAEMWEHIQCTRWEQKCEGMFSVLDGRKVEEEI